MELRRKLAIVAGIYLVEGFPMGVFAEVMPVYLREAGATLTTIGLLSGLRVAWSAKALWSPLLHRFGEHRQWIVAALVCMALALLVLASVDPVAALPALTVALFVFCAASATQDIAIDAYTIGLVDRGEEGPANSTRIIAYRVALIAAGALLLLPASLGWSSALAAGAAMLVGMAIFVGRCPPVPVSPAARRDLRGAFRTWLGRGGWAPVLGFVLLYRVGDLALGPMLKPFWVDHGFSREEIALVSVTLGSLATMGGALAGGWVVHRAGIAHALWIVGALALGSNLAYAGAALAPGPAAVYSASLVESFCGGLAAAGFLSFLMRICEREHATVQYAVLTGVYALPGAVAGALSGAAVEQLGYALFFAATVLLSAPAFVFWPWARRWSEAAQDGS